MADFSTIIQEINEDITTNGVGAITGAKLNEVLHDMIAAVNAEKQDPLTIDATPTEDSTNPVQSGGVYEALEHKPTIYHITNIQAIPPTIISILRAGDILRSGGEHDSIAVVCKIDNNDIYFVSTDGDMVETFLYRNGVFYDYFAYQLSDLANKVPDATQGDLAGLDSDGNLTDSGIAASDVATTSDLAGKQDVISDLATIRSGAAAGATAYQKPSGGIPKTDLASGVQTSLGKADTAFQKPSGGIPASDLSTAVQTSLGKADTAVQQVTVGTTTTGNAGTNASVTNSGTATNPVLDFTIPRGADGANGQDGADAVNPFKGWFASANALPANPAVGDYAYVKGANASDPAAIYECTTAGTWSDSGRTADTSNVQTFATGEEVNEVHIVNDLTTGGVDDVLSAEQGKNLNIRLIGQEQNYTDGYYVATGGVITENSDWLCSDFVAVSNGTLIWNPGSTSLYAAVLQRYDADKQPMGGGYNANATTRTINLSGVSYVRASFAKSNKANAKLILNDVTIWQPLEEIIGLEQVVSELDSTSVKRKDVDGDEMLTSADDINAMINNQGYVFINVAPASIYLLPCESGQGFAIYPQSGKEFAYAFLTSNNFVNGTIAPFANGYSQPIWRNSVVFVQVPSDANYLYLFHTTTNGDDYGPSKVILTDNINIVSCEEQFISEGKKKQARDNIGAIGQEDIFVLSNELGLHTYPENEGQLNVVKRCRQLTDIEWTPAADLPRCEMPSLTNPDVYPTGEQFYENVFKAGVKYRGIPYGRCETYKPGYGYGQTYVGLTIDFGTFVTSVRNKDSMICKESVFNLADHRSVPYASVCSALTCYALNVPFTGTSGIPSITGMNEVADVISEGVRMDLKSLKLGDILNKFNTHTGVVTDIVMDNGEVTFVEISESTPVGNGNLDVEGSEQGGVCRRKGWNVEDFFWYWGAYKVLRYSNISSVPYSKNPYVSIGNELDEKPYLDYSVMPYEGNGFVYKTGYVSGVKLIIACNGFSHLRVFKGDTEISGSPFLLTVNDTEKTINEVSAGNYSAYLCNMSNGTDTTLTGRCRWSIV